MGICGTGTGSGLPVRGGHLGVRGRRCDVGPRVQRLSLLLGRDLLEPPGHRRRPAHSAWRSTRSIRCPFRPRSTRMSSPCPGDDAAMFVAAAVAAANWTATCTGTQIGWCDCDRCTRAAAPGAEGNSRAPDGGSDVESQARTRALRRCGRRHQRRRRRRPVTGPRSGWLPLGSRRRFTPGGSAFATLEFYARAMDGQQPMSLRMPKPGPGLYGDSQNDRGARESSSLPPPLGRAGRRAWAVPLLVCILDLGLRPALAPRDVRLCLTSRTEWSQFPLFSLAGIYFLGAPLREARWGAFRFCALLPDR